MASISSPGIGSNLDVNGIVSQLMAVERQPLQALDSKEASFQAQLSAFGTMKSALTNFQTALKSLNDVGRFQTYKASVGDSTVATVAAANNAAPGNYSLEVGKLAQSQKLVAAGVASSSSIIGTGTITLEFGTISGGTFDDNTGKYTGATFTANGAGAKSVTISSSNNTLTGIRDAINAAKAGVTASIVNDGSGAPYRLSLAVNNSGADKSLRISVAGDAPLSSLLSHDASATQNLAETATASNAEFSLDGVAITKSSNSVTDALEGVTINLLKANIGATTQISVLRDSTATKSAADSLVKAYNDVNTTLKNLGAFNAASKTGTILQGDVTLITLHARIRATLTDALKGAAGSYNNLSQIGIAFTKEGTLALDSAKFQTALDEAPDDIAPLFAAVGRATDSAIRYDSSTDATKPGKYDINISQLATKGTQVGSAAAALTITAGVNDSFTANVDGVSAVITLTANTYASAADLAREVQSKINGASAISGAGNTITVAESGGILTLTSERYGSTSSVQISSGNAMADLLGGAPVTTAGLNVEGTINGAAGTGSGRFLTDLGGGASSGLKIEVTGGALGARGSINFSRGYAVQLDKLVTDFLDTRGAITARTDGINASIKSIDQRRQQMQERLVGVETRIRAQFTALDTLIARMNTTSQFLTQQLATLANLGSN